MQMIIKLFIWIRTQTVKSYFSCNNLNQQLNKFYTLSNNVFIYSFSGQIATIQENLRIAEIAKADAEVLANNAGSVDKTVIETLRRDAREQKQMVILPVFLLNNTKASVNSKIG